MIIKEDKPHEYLKTIHNFQQNQFKQNKPACGPSQSVKSLKVSSFKDDETEITMDSGSLNSSKMTKTKSLVSNEIIVGLDFILKTLGDSKKVTRSSNRITRKRKSIKKIKAFKAKSIPLKRGNKINIPTDRLSSIVDSLILI
mmetsp:Transcript_2174/g.2504  ORF Transcript_2174/g.2504 Transcript_2174/m.2504 type:complete len:142 (+) Transcript_2174:498-923(+)